MDNYKSEQEFLEKYDSSEYEKPSVTVDLLVFTIKDNDLKIVLVKREDYPYKNYLALPGVFVGIDESLDDAVKRGIKGKAGFNDIYFEQLYTWGSVNRDPRMRIISVSYIALVTPDKIDFNESNAQLYSVDEILKSDIKIAFDHKKMIEYGRERIRGKVNYTNVAFEFVNDEFTLPNLQKVYEILLGKALYKANFRKRVAEFIVDTGKMTSGDAHRPSKIYRLKKKNRNRQTESID